MKLVECVPNFSEGRDKVKVESIVSAAKSVPGVRVLDIEMDPDHHRSVLSFVAPPEAALEAAYRSAVKAQELIDLTRHKGEHPRMGAVDVIPFIPVAGTTIGDCVALAKSLGERIGRDLQIPVYLYDRAAQRPDRADLAKVRKGQFEGLREEIGKNPEREPDFGPPRIHPTAGAVAVGAREQIINFNVNFSHLTLEDAKAIAKKVRTSGGGLPHLRAKEVDLAARGLVQISTVLTDYSVTGLGDVYDALAAGASAIGAEIVGTEIVGLIPRKALMNFAIERIKVENFDPTIQVLENRLESLAQDWETSATRVAEALASTNPTPGGGSAAAIASALGCALGQMAAGISLESKKLDPSKKPILQKFLLELKELCARFQNLAGQDAAAFEGFMAVAKLPKEDPMRGERMQQALKIAAEVPLHTARTALSAWRILQELFPHTIGTVASDARCAVHLVRAGALCALENVHINLPLLKDSVLAQSLGQEAEVLRKELA